MRKITVVCFLLLTLSFSVSASSVIVPSRDSLTLDEKTIAREAFNELKNLPRSERKLRLKQAKKEIRQFKAARKAGKEADTSTLLLAILAILLPPLAVYLYEQETTTKFWITLLLFLLGIAGAVFFSWLLIFASVVYALLVVFGVA